MTDPLLIEAIGWMLVFAGFVSSSLAFVVVMVIIKDLFK